jgi:hypothetical protein
MKPVNSKKNKNILTYLKVLKYLNLPEFNDLKIEIEKSIQTGMRYFINKVKEV